MPSRIFNRLRRDQRGVTGLETAIILIAFVVVASVFAYTVLSAGIFSSEKGKEAIHAGLETARGSMELVGSVKATSIAATTIDAADGTTYTPSANVTAATDTSDYKEGTGSIALTIDNAFTTGLAAYTDFSAVDLTSPQHYSVQLWIKSDTDLAAGVLQLVLDESAGCGSAEETLDLPALTADTWTNPVLTLAAETADNAILCAGIQVATDTGATVVVNIDNIEAPEEVTELNFVVANALNGEPINLTTTTDADSDGLISDETTLSHELSVIYQDDEQRTTDVTWTRTELGRGDGDALLEPGEKMRITVNTHAASPMPVANTVFSLTLTRGEGADMVLERTLPGDLDTQMDLN